MINKKQKISDNKGEVVSITYEEIGLFPRSFSRVLDRFLKQIFSDVENLVIQEYRFYRYLFLTTFKSLLILFFIPFFINFLAKNYIIRPLTEYFWNTKGTEIFLNSYQQKHAFAELKDFEEKLYFESLIYPKSDILESRIISPKPDSTLYDSFPKVPNAFDTKGTASETGKNEIDNKTEYLVNSYTVKTSLFVYQTREVDKNIQQRYQEKTIILAQHYNDQSIEAITNFFGDIVL